MAARPRTTWAEKLAANNGLPKVVTLEGKARAKWGALAERTEAGHE